jgi:hypothetical protein
MSRLQQDTFIDDEEEYWYVTAVVLCSPPSR